jgi:HlyD family secretion protein
VLYALGSLLAMIGVSVGLHELRPAAPSVQRTSVWMDTVRRGPMVRDVLGQGTLVPEEVRWLAARSTAQVVRILVEPGAVVQAATVIALLENSELELAALEAERQLSQAEAELVNLQASLSAQELAQESAVATIASDLADAVRQARADDELARRGFLSVLEQEQTLGRERELRGRLEFEQKRRVALARGVQAQVSAQGAQIGRLRSIAEFRRQEIDGLQVRAGMDGVLQQLSIEQGQSVAAGAPLAKLVRPDRLKAEIRIPETRAADLQLGQPATIDTRNGIIRGHVARIDPAAQAGTVRVDVSLEQPLPAGVRPDSNVEGSIELERLPSVVFVGRPAVAQPGTTTTLFKLDADGNGAERTTVRLGRSSVTSVEILAGLREGDRVILSELSQWDDVDRIRLQ